MYYLASLLFMILSAKGIYVYEIYYILLDIVLIWVGLEKNRFKKSDFELFLKFSAIYIAFVTFRYLFINQLEIKFYLSDLNFLIKYIFLSFLYCAVLRDKALYYIIKIIIHGAIISLPFYFLQLASGDLVYTIGHLLKLPAKWRPEDYTNFIVFTFDRLHSIRNSGFSWEPGAYGCFLNLGLLLYLVTNNFVFDKKAKLLVVAIITTLSTTSYIAFFVIWFMHYRANGGKLNKFILIAVPILCVAAFQVPFLINKIITIYNRDQNDIERMQDLSRFYLRHGEQFPLNRFSSFIYIYNLYNTKLIWGMSNIYQEKGAALNNFNISNGFIDFLAKFGLIGLAFLMYKYILLLKKLLVTNELASYAVLNILILSFGEPLLIFQLTLTFLFLYHYTNPDTYFVLTNNTDLNLIEEKEESNEYRFIKG